MDISLLLAQLFVIIVSGLAIAAIIGVIWFITFLLNKLFGAKITEKIREKQRVIPDFKRYIICDLKLEKDKLNNMLVRLIKESVEENSELYFFNQKNMILDSLKAISELFLQEQKIEFTLSQAEIDFALEDDEMRSIELVRNFVKKGSIVLNPRVGSAHQSRPRFYFRRKIWVNEKIPDDLDEDGRFEKLSEL